jgi:VWFA-related protein
LVAARIAFVSIFLEVGEGAESTILGMRTFLIFLMLLSQSSPVQSPTVEPSAEEHSISLNVNIVNVLFTVSDRKGRFVKTLPQNKFRVFEDNKAQSITHFSSETDLPLTVALLIDTSGSVGDKLVFEQKAASEFLRSTLRPGKDKALLISFDTRAHLLQDYTDDTAALGRAAEKIRAGGSTAMYDAVYLATSEKLINQAGRHILILISDGVDTFSRKSLDDVLRNAQQNDTAIYCISTNSLLKNSPRDAAIGNRALRRLAEETGGRIFLPITTDELSANFKKIDEELRSQYAITYHPNNTIQDGAFHRIRIETVDRQLRVQSRNGYFDSQNN